MKEILEDLRKDVREVRESQIRMESDLKYHIRRTDLLEDAIENQKQLLEPMMVFRFLRTNLKFLMVMMAAIAAVVALMIEKGIL